MDKVRLVLQGEKLQEGATVLIEFGKELFEASVVKLHVSKTLLHVLVSPMILFAVSPCND